MGRLNYTNRKIEGLKLGQVVAKDLLKRIPPGTGHKSALRDPCVELDVSGKSLTDTGFREAAEALITSISYRADLDKVVRLEELSLKGNQLTTDSLVLIGKIVSLAAHDLKDLDLSDNLITVFTARDAAAWGFFLSSFSRCCVLRRVDLGGNGLGPKAFEILARVYGKEDPLDLQFTNWSSVSYDAGTKYMTGSPINADGIEKGARRMSLIGTSNESRSGMRDDGLDGQRRSRPDSISPQKQSPSKLGQSTLQSNMLRIYRTTRGLRSVPYLILSNTAMTESCALHLSYIITSHRLPHQLLSRVPPAKAGQSAQQLEAYDKDSGCQGVVYLPNSTLTVVGTKVLDLSELARVGALDDTAQSENLSDTRTNHHIGSPARRSSEFAMSSFHHDQVNRRKSLTQATCEEYDTPRHTLGELDRARSRIQGNTLRDVGPGDNDLWFTALKMLSMSRTILLRSFHKKSEYKHQGRQEGKEEPLSYHQPGYVSRTATPRSVTPLGTADPNQSIILRLPGKRKESLVMPKLAMTPISHPVTKSNSGSLQHLRQDIPYRSSLLGGLGMENWRNIIALATDSIGISSKVQQRAIMKWALDRGTLVKEVEILGKQESAQIWKVLEGMGCLAYEMKC